MDLSGPIHIIGFTSKIEKRKKEKKIIEKMPRKLSFISFFFIGIEQFPGKETSIN